MDTKALYTQKYGQLFSAFVALSTLVSLIFFGSVLANEHAPMKSNETATTAEVARVTYGLELESSSEQRQRNVEFQKCFIEFSDGTVLDQPVLGCEAKAGDTLTLFTSSDETRIDPQQFPIAIMALQFYVITSLSLFVGALLLLIYFTVKKVKIEREAFDAIRL